MIVIYFLNFLFMFLFKINLFVYIVYFTCIMDICNINFRIIFFLLYLYVVLDIFFYCIVFLVFFFLLLVYKVEYDSSYMV